MTNTPATISGKRIAWVLPQIEPGSGGLQTICRHISFLQSRGAVCDAIVCQPKSADSKEGVQKLMRDSYQCEPDDIYVTGFSPKSYDFAVATLNLTVPFARVVDAAHKFYFVQDYEPYFYSMGDEYLAARRTYTAGLSIVTIGRWLAHKLYEEHGASAWYTDFAADEAIYRPLGCERRHAVCAIYQPDKPRRCPELVLDALEVAHAIDPTLEIVLYGANGTFDFPFPVDYRGLVSKDECNRIYNECSVGLCISSTNPSRIPFEMMAAGLPVVDVYRENTRWDFDANCSLLAEPTPASLAMAILKVAGDADHARALGEAGIRFMAERGGNSEQRAFEDALLDALNGRGPVKVDRVSGEYAYKKPIKAPGEVVGVQDALQARKLHTLIAPPAVNCSASYARLSIEGLPCNGTHVGVYAIVVPATAKDRGRRFDAYGFEDGRVLLQIDFNRLECRSDLYVCNLYVEGGGDCQFVAEFSIRCWFDGSEFASEAGPLTYYDPKSSAPRVIGYEFSRKPFANFAQAAAFALLPTSTLDVIKPIAKTVLKR